MPRTSTLNTVTAIGIDMGAVDQVPHLLRHAGKTNEFGDVTEEVLQVNFLLIACTESRACLLPNQSHDR